MYLLGLYMVERPCGKVVTDVGWRDKWRKASDIIFHLFPRREVVREGQSVRVNARLVIDPLID